MERVAEVLLEKGIAEGKLGIEMKYVTKAYFQDLVSRVPKATFVPCEDLFFNARMIKTAGELDLLSRAARITEKALLATYATISVGETERSMAQRLAASMRGGGLESIKFLYINSGPNTGFPHCGATAHRAELGEVVKSDVGGWLEGYPSDVARTAVIGPPTDRQRSIYDRLMDIHDETIAEARPGRRACDLFEVAKEGYVKRDIPFSLPHAGHGIGLQGHEQPLLTALNTTPFEPNMVICVETRVRWIGQEGYHIEDLVLVTEQGPKLLTGYFDNREIFEI
jgi:Xaa-Pro aminopeptidase